MKKYICKFLAILCLCSLFSCSKDDNVNYEPAPSPFSANIDGSGNIGAAGGTVNILITAGTDGWTVSIPTTSPWCTSSKVYGSGDYILPVKIAVNTTGLERTTLVTLTPTFKLDPVNVLITQAK